MGTWAVRLVVPNKGYSSLDQSPDEKPLVALDTDSDDDFDMSRYSSSGYSSAEQIQPGLEHPTAKGSVSD
uniref:Uncharacterized protein n=1 Tax=Sphaerodactylus townsendi TaxID=933632 RepID=A0ACB8EP40_9SAUR